MISTPQKALMMPFAPELEKSKWFSFSSLLVRPRLFSPSIPPLTINISQHNLCRDMDIVSTFRHYQQKMDFHKLFA